MKTMNANQVFKTARYLIDTDSYRSAWSKGVKAYADELLDELEESVRGGWVELDDLQSSNMIKKALLNGASGWNEYSWGGCSLIYDEDIAKRLCTPSELKRTHNGERKPNRGEEWLDVQRRALHQASAIVVCAIESAME